MYSKMGIATMALVGLVAPAQANTTRFFSAADCLANASADNSMLARLADGCYNYYTGIGGFNPSTGRCGPAMSVALPITGNTSDTVDFDAITVNYTSGNSSESIDCTAFVVNSAGTTYATGTKSSTLPFGLTNQATGAITWTGTSLPNAGNAISNARSETIFCTVPTRWTLYPEDECFLATFFSVITNYVVETVQP